MALQSALDRLIAAGLLLENGVPPHATYFFKHALVQDAAYSTLLRETRRALHARIAEAPREPIRRDCRKPTGVAGTSLHGGRADREGLEPWGKAGQRSLARSALVEAAEQLSRALAQIAALPATPALRRDEIKLQVGLVNALMHVKGYAAPETKAAIERARTLMERAEAFGEPPEDPLILSSVLYALWTANTMAFNGDICRDLAAQFLALAEKQRATGPLMIGHRVMGMSLLYTGDIAESRVHYDRAVALYDFAEHRSLATRFAVDPGAANLLSRSQALWLLGYPEAALADTDLAVKNARETGHAATLMYLLNFTSSIHIFCGNYAEATAQLDEVIALADEKGALIWKAFGVVFQGWVLALTGKAPDAIQLIASAITALRSTGTTLLVPLDLSNLARAHAALGQFDDAWRRVGEAMTAVEATKERWAEAEVNRIAGVIALKSREPNAAKAEAYFERALAVAREQQAKSWELRVATSMARLWRDQGKPDEARDLLAPVYGWFTEGFGTLDLNEAKALLDALAE